MAKRMSNSHWQASRRGCPPPVCPGDRDETSCKSSCVGSHEPSNSLGEALRTAGVTETKTQQSSV